MTYEDLKDLMAYQQQTAVFCPPNTNRASLKAGFTTPISQENQDKERLKSANGTFGS